MNLRKGIGYFEKTNKEEVILSSVNIIDRDINGGLGFEVAKREIIYTGDVWRLKCHHYQNTQPEWGPTITKDIEEYDKEVTVDSLIDFIRGDSITVEELNAFFESLVKK